MSVLRFTVTDLLLAYESITSSASVRFTAEHSIFLRMNPRLRLTDLRMNWLMTPVRLTQFSQSYITTDGQSASLSWNKAPSWGL
jgi:hypothetical protein